MRQRARWFNQFPLARCLLDGARMLRAALVFSLLAGCATAQTEHDDFDSIELGDEKADLPSRPTDKGPLVTGKATRDSLRPITSGYHRYTFHAEKDEWVRIYLDSPDYRPYLRVTGPAGASQMWSDTALDFYHPVDHVYWALVDFEAPETGTYEVLSSSVWNMRFFPVPKTWGDYILTQMSERCDDDGEC
jgi:hypothetical protein